MFFYATVGTFKIRDEQIISSVIDTALECGYRLIGTHPKLALFPRLLYIGMDDNLETKQTPMQEHGVLRI